MSDSFEGAAGGQVLRRGRIARRVALDIGFPLLAIAAAWSAPRELAWEGLDTSLFWLGVVLAVSFLPLRMPLAGGVEAISPAVAPVFALGLLLGPSPAALAGGLSGLASSLLWRRAGLMERVRLAARTAMAGAAAAYMFDLSGGFIYPGLANSLFALDGADVLPLCAAGICFYATYLVSGAFQIAVDEDLSLGRILVSSGRRLGLVAVSYCILGFLMAVAYLRVGPGSTILLLPALVVTQGSLKTHLDLERARASAIRALSSAIDARDPYTRGHSERVARYAVRVARHMGLAESMVEALEVAALLHDLGKVSIDSEVLAKPAPLKPDEKAQMHLHADAGARVMAEMAYLARHTDMVRCHHERLDGGGYPRGLRAEEIPLGARILHVVDALDAMTSDRPYRRALPREQAVEELRSGVGGQFDHRVVEVVLELMRRGEFVFSPTGRESNDAGEGRGEDNRGLQHVNHRGALETSGPRTSPRVPSGSLESPDR